MLKLSTKYRRKFSVAVAIGDKSGSIKCSLSEHYDCTNTVHLQQNQMLCTRYICGISVSGSLASEFFRNSSWWANTTFLCWKSSSLGWLTKDDKQPTHTFFSLVFQYRKNFRLWVAYQFELSKISQVDLTILFLENFLFVLCNIVNSETGQWYFWTLTLFKHCSLSGKSIFFNCVVSIRLMKWRFF